ncbi:hypothetical protein P2G88_05655 [Aliiglaciecola sp. CAU 1673]|uniref:hypothetical protein n=1 Tax=Aliiglaciecola sp. CAU 1673 TaxID=3032595 RepID=UPI0023DC474D|nr:hypothetical protein [Aliiglaciecola sp. CAU 1673]MDF2177729.1 hypothetical protein [Aliiglaciecola sp. CAU 1673]
MKLVVVVNHSNPIDELDQKQVMDLYMGRYTSFPNSMPATPIDYPSNSAVKQQFYKMLVNKDEKKIRAYWSRLLFSGRAKPPMEAESGENIPTLLADNNAALAYVPVDQVTSEMKIVFQFNP